jgi:predicted GIY-YIG superfamily endonuclease
MNDVTKNEETKHYWLYALRLNEGKYYIGTTSKKDPNHRIQEHMNGFYSAQWVRKYKPIEPVEIIDIGNITKEQAELLEQHRTLQYMEKYGHQNVRGGSLNYSGKYVKVGDRFYQDKDFVGRIGIGIMFASALLLALMAWK